MREHAVLLLVLAAECVAFALLAPTFGTLGNAFEITRATTELGLLALGMTLVVKAGAIDLSVGSIMGLAAVALGGCHAAGLGIVTGVAAALAVGLSCGLVNGAVVAHGRVPPLVATLATMALYRGVAEGTTGGYAVFTGFPAGFLFAGQGYLLGTIPAQLPLLVAVAAAAWLLAHRAPFGRRLTAIGLAPAAARHATVRVERHLIAVHAVMGLLAGAAAVIYVAHLGQAKADAGTGFELTAITVVVLGGASITGGEGRVAGTLLSLLCLAVLQNGLLLCGLPNELASILLGVLLVGAVALGRARPSLASAPAPAASSADLDMKNSQVAVIVAAILLGALIIALGNAWLVRSLVPAGGGR